MQYHGGQREYCSSYLAQKWQMRVDQMFLFEMLEQLDRRAPPNADDAARAPWRSTQSCDCIGTITQNAIISQHDCIPAEISIEVRDVMISNKQVNSSHFEIAFLLSMKV